MAIQEERLTRRKRDRIDLSQNSLAIQYCLQHAGIGPEDLSLIVTCPQAWSQLPDSDPHLSGQLRPQLHGVQTIVVPHHLGHVISAFALSGFASAAGLVIDGGGSPLTDLHFGGNMEKGPVQFSDPGPADDSSATRPWYYEGASLYRVTRTEIRLLEKHMYYPWIIEHPHVAPGTLPRFRSLGNLFSAAATRIFGDESEAGKVMGLAPYGDARFAAERFFRIEDGRFCWYDDLPKELPPVGQWPQAQDAHRELAASVQAALERALHYLWLRLGELSEERQLVYGGGVALNSVANQKLAETATFDDHYIVSAAEDSGPAIGAAFYGYFLRHGHFPTSYTPSDAFGASYSGKDIDTAAQRAPRVIEIKPDSLIEGVVDRLRDGRIIGWVQGGAELGPRALGHRSILCDPRRPDAKDVVNAKVKHREAFRPFAPAILREHASEWFEWRGTSPESPFMLRVVPFRRELAGQVPAVAHVDGTGRVQTVSERDGRLYHLLLAFYRATGIPILLNTSFNVAGEPIIETPDQALWCMLYTGVDDVIIEDRLFTTQQGYSSILQLIPSIAATSLSVTHDTKNGCLDSGLERLQCSATVETRWGTKTTPTLDALAYRVLSHIDGQKTAQEIFEIMREEFKPGESQYVRILGMLTRFGVLSWAATETR